MAQACHFERILREIPENFLEINTLRDFSFRFATFEMTCIPNLDILNIESLADFYHPSAKTTYCLP
jgi:hypothetical protein